ncbi:MAG: aminotransferase class V-fold PLP-dependent enzyme, partial [Bacteroidales bacterium]|nr:aminotransferase class V-fold PLP-dependent enzyme [Bacteroidales bacterium]
AIRTALSIQLKEQIGTTHIKKREQELVRIAFKKMETIPGIHILADNTRERLGIISFYLDGLHYNLVVKLLNDHFGIQVRGGCACAGTYGHFLLDVSYEHSKEITDKISHGDLSEKPGWVRLSIHPVMTDKEVLFICDAIKLVAENGKKWGKKYIYNQQINEFRHESEPEDKTSIVAKWFDL